MALVRLGGGMFAVGYAPVFGAAIPSTVGLLGRAVGWVGTVGIAPFVACVLPYIGEDDPAAGPHVSHDHGYFCSGQHGSMQLMLPVAGPFLFAAHHPKDSLLNKDGAELSPTARDLLRASGVVQIVGIATGLAGLAAGSYVGDGPTAASSSRGLEDAGVVLAGGAYLSTAIVGVPSLFVGATTSIDGIGRAEPSGLHTGGSLLTLPVVGPFLYLANVPRDDLLNPTGAPLSRTSRALLIASGSAQAAGLGLMLAATVKMPRGTDGARTEQKSAVHVAPFLATRGGGVTLRMGGW